VPLIRGLARHSHTRDDTGVSSNRTYAKEWKYRWRKINCLATYFYERIKEDPLIGLVFSSGNF
jgi:hypothetical protein